MNNHTAKQLATLAQQLKTLTSDRSRFLDTPPLSIQLNYPAAFLNLSEGSLSALQDALLGELDKQIAHVQQQMKDLLAG